MQVSGKVVEISKFCAGGSPDAVVDVVEKGLWGGASARLKQGLFDITNKKASKELESCIVPDKDENCQN